MNELNEIVPVEHNAQGFVDTADTDINVKNFNEKFSCLNQNEVNVKISEIPQHIVPFIDPIGYMNVMIVFYLYTKQMDTLCGRNKRRNVLCELDDADEYVVNFNNLFECTSRFTQKLMDLAHIDPNFCWEQVEMDTVDPDEYCLKMSDVIAELKKIVNHCGEMTAVYAFRKLECSLIANNLCSKFIY